jgi:hypothetical protein
LTGLLSRKRKSEKEERDLGGRDGVLLHQLLDVGDQLLDVGEEAKFCQLVLCGGSGRWKRASKGVVTNVRR